MQKKKKCIFFFSYLNLKEAVSLWNTKMSRLLRFTILFLLLLAFVGPFVASESYWAERSYLFSANIDCIDSPHVGLSTWCKNYRRRWTVDCKFSSFFFLFFFYFLNNLISQTNCFCAKFCKLFVSAGFFRRYLQKWQCKMKEVKNSQCNHKQFL